MSTFNGHDRLRAPDGGVRYEGRFYKPGQLLPERYRRLNGSHSDPASGVEFASPNFGRFPLPHAITFVAKQSTIANVYRNPDEAIQRSGGQAWKMRRDPVIMGPLEARQRAVALLNWHLEVEDENDPKQKELQTELTRIIKRCWNFTEYRRVLLEALWYGRYAVQHKFGFTMVNGKRRCIVQDWRPVNGDKLIFRFDDGSGRYSDDEVGIRVTPIYGQHDKMAGDRQLEITDQGMCYFLEPWERSLMAIHRHIIEDGDYEDPISAGRVHGVGIRDRIWWCWYQKQETMAQMMEVINRTGSGITIYWYPAGDEKAKQQQLEIAEKQRYDNVLVMPRMSGDPATDAYGIERIEPTATGVQLLQGVVHEFFGHQIVRYIAGQTLSSESSAMGIGSGAADFQSETWFQIVRYDAVKLEETLTHELIDRALKPFNFPWAKDIPVWFRVDTQSPESQSKLAAIKTAWDMGADIKASDVMDVVGLSMPGPGDKTLQNPAIVQQARLAANEFGGNPQAGDELRDLFGPLAETLQGGQPEGQGEEGPEGEQPAKPEEAATPPGPGRYSKIQSGQMPLWKEQLHPREENGEFAEKHGIQPMHADQWLQKRDETNLYADSPTAQSIQQHLFKTLASADLHPEQVKAMLSGDAQHVNALKQAALDRGQHEPFGLAPQKEVIGRGLGAEEATPETGGEQGAFWHGMQDKPGQKKMFEGMDRASPEDKPTEEGEWSAESEATLAKKAQSGDKEARATMLKQFTPLVKNLAGKALSSKRDDKDEFVQVGLIAVNRAIDHYDPSIARFSTFAVKAITRAILRAKQKASRGGVQLGEDDEGKTIEPEDKRAKRPDQEASTKEQKAWLDKALGKLPKNHETVLRRALEGGSQQEIADELGLSRQRVHQLHQSGLAKLKQMQGQKTFKALSYSRSPSSLYRYFLKNKLWNA